MKYCPNCGNTVNQNAKFCPSCGNKISITNTETEEGVFTKMEKGAVKSLQNQVSETVQNKVENTFQEKTNNIFQEKVEEPIEKNISKTNKKQSMVPLLWYILFSILLYTFGDSSETISGVMFFTVVTLIIYFIRRKKSQPINWISIIILVLQALLIFSFLMEMSDLLFVNEITSLLTLLFIGLLFSIGYLILKRNKLQQV